MKLKTLILAAVLLAAFIAPAFSQEMPAPGTVIDKNNYKKYAHLFPEEFAPAFVDGWGLFPPIHMNVVETKPRSMPKAYLDYCAKNKGKYTLDAQGFPNPAFTRDGMPFPDLKPSDKDFATKLMWNYEVRYMYDEILETGEGASFQKRRGEKLAYNRATAIELRFKNRIAVPPKPYLDNPAGVYYAFLFHYISPESIKNTITLTHRYADMKKPDDTYLYLPALRRVLRAEAGQRSTPLLGSIQALDDINGFDGRTAEFTYSFVKEQKVLAVTDDKTTAKITKTWNKDELPVVYDGYEVRDAYVIDIKPKDPKYPQSKKRVYLDKNTLSPYYIVVWDRAGKVWKVWCMPYKQHALPDGTTTQIASGTLGIDMQFGMATNYVADFRANKDHFTWNDVTSASLLKRAR